jgi:PAS domain S-box-containing protein
VKWYGTAIEIEDRKRAEEKLRESETYLSEAQRLTHTGSMYWKVARGELFWSDETFRIFEYDVTATPSAELLYQRIHPDDLALVQETHERQLNEGIDVDIEYRLRMPDGRVKHLHAVAHPLRDSSGNLELVAAVMDVSDRRHAEDERERLLAREQAAHAEVVAAQHRFGALVNSIEGVVWELDVPTFTFLFVSQQAERMLGYPIARWLKEPTFWSDHIHSDDRAWAVDFCVTATGEKRDHDFEYRMVAADGRIVWIRDLVTVVVEGGQAAKLRGVMFDITERKRDELLLARAKRLLEMIARGEPRALILDGLCRLVEELVSGSLASILLLDPNARCLRHGAAPSLPIPYIEAIDGIVIGPSVGSCGTAAYHGQPVIVSDVATDPLWADFRDLALGHGLRACWSTPIVSSDGRVLGTFAIYYREPRRPTSREHNLIEQITHLASIAVEREQAEEALRQAQADLAHVNRVTTMGELTASVAHEVKQPITAALTNANTCVLWLGGDTPNIDEARAAAMRIVEDGTRAADIIDRIRLLFTKGTPQREWVDVNALIRQMVVLLRSEAARHAIAVRAELAADLPRVMGDRVQLQQVLMNLVMNGIDAMKDVEGMRELTITSQRTEGEDILVSVSDTGVGLPLDRADEIFKAFVTTKPHGTGMGLSISRSILGSHGGRLWADRNFPRGARFHLTLPTRVEAHEAGS